MKKCNEEKAYLITLIGRFGPLMSILFWNCWEGRRKIRKIWEKKKSWENLDSGKKSKVRLKKNKKRNKEKCQEKCWPTEKKVCYKKVKNIRKTKEAIIRNFTPREKKERR